MLGVFLVAHATIRKLRLLDVLANLFQQVTFKLAPNFFVHLLVQSISAALGLTYHDILLP
jgi:hypothetical protein